MQVLRCQVTVIQEQLKDKQKDGTASKSHTKLNSPKHTKEYPSKQSKASSKDGENDGSSSPDKKAEDKAKESNKPVGLKGGSSSTIEEGVTSASSESPLFPSEKIPSPKENTVSVMVCSSSAPSHSTVTLTSPVVSSASPSSRTSVSSGTPTVHLPKTTASQNGTLASSSDYDGEEPTFKVHRGPNVKYHVMVHKDSDDSVRSTDCKAVSPKGASAKTSNDFYVMRTRERLSAPSKEDEAKLKDRSLTDLLSDVKNSNDKTIRAILSDRQEEPRARKTAMSSNKKSSLRTHDGVTGVSSSSLVAKIINSKLNSKASGRQEDSSDDTATASSKPHVTNYRKMSAAIEKPPRRTRVAIAESSNRGATLSSKFLSSASSRMDDVSANGVVATHFNRFRGDGEGLPQRAPLARRESLYTLQPSLSSSNTTTVTVHSFNIANNPPTTNLSSVSSNHALLTSKPVSSANVTPSAKGPPCNKVNSNLCSSINNISSINLTLTNSTESSLSSYKSVNNSSSSSPDIVSNLSKSSTGAGSTTPNVVAAKSAKSNSLQRSGGSRSSFKSKRQIFSSSRNGSKESSLSSGGGAKNSLASGTYSRSNGGKLQHSSSSASGGAGSESRPSSSASCSNNKARISAIFKWFN